MSTNGFDDRNIIGLFRASYDRAMQDAWIGGLGVEVPSDSAQETYGFLGASPGMREWIGARQGQTYNKNQYTVRNRPFESTLVVRQSDLDRDKSGLLKGQVDNFANEAGAGHWTELIIDLINANGLCYDGIAFFSASHSWGSSGTQKNLLGATEIPSSNVGTTTAPTPAEAANIIMEMVGYQMSLLNDKGKPINGSARKFTVLTGTNKIFSACAQAIQGNPLLSSGVTIANPLQGLTSKGFTFDVALDPRLTSATEKICLFRADGPFKPFLLQNERPIRYQTLGPGSDFYFDNNAYKLGVDCSRAAGYFLWEYASYVIMT